MKSVLVAVLLAFDGGVALDAGVRWLTAEDQEVVDNLELLENLENAKDFDLLQVLELER